MAWLSLRLAFQGGREAVIRLIATIIAVAIGVTLLLSVLAQFHGFQEAGSRPCWECTTKTGQGDKSDTSEDDLLWLYRKDAFKGQEIKRLDLAALGSQAPVLPGISRLPREGEFYVSPALADLLKTVSRDELGDRFPGTQVGIIGDEALAGPDALVAYVGRVPAELSLSSQAFRTDTIITAPKVTEFTTFSQFAFVMGAAGLLFPIFILIGTATRLSAARREERYAAMRLVGATPRQVNIIASVDAIVGAMLGVVAGTLLFMLLRPEVANLTVTGMRFFAYDVTPTVFEYVAILLGTPLAAAVAALVSLRKVRISPLGVSRKVTPAAPKVWHTLPFLIGLILFVSVIALSDNKSPITPAALPGFALIMIGLVVGGPWLTMQATRLMVRLTRSGAALLAGRRLVNDPKAAFRSVSGLALAVFVGTLVTTVAPVILKTSNTAKTDALTNVLTTAFFNTGDPDCNDDCDHVAGFQEGLSPEDGTKLIAELQANPGVKAFPVYAAPLSPPSSSTPHAEQGRGSGGESKSGTKLNSGGKVMQIMSCDSLRQLSLFGQCAPGVKALKVVGVDENVILYHSEDPIVDANSQPTKDDFSGLPLRAVFVKVDNASSIEKVRTLLTLKVKSLSGHVPRTFGEVRQDKLALSLALQQMILVAIIMTLLIAGCSLAVAVGSSLVERKRPFTLLRLSGVPLGVLYRVVIWEAIVPLIVVTVVAAGTSFGLASAMIVTLAPAGTPIIVPGLVYGMVIIAGLLVSLAIVCVTLPLIGRITKPDDARFE